MSEISDMAESLVRIGMERESAIVSANNILERICDGLVRDGRVKVKDKTFFVHYDKKDKSAMVVVKIRSRDGIDSYREFEMPRRLREIILYSCLSRDYGNTSNDK